MSSRARSGKARARESKRRNNLQRQNRSRDDAGNPAEGGPPQEEDIVVGAAFRTLDSTMTAPINGIMINLSKFLHLLRWAIDTAMPPADALFPNTVSAVACLARAYHGLQASAWLCLAGFYLEARTMVRGVYESAGLGRMLAKDSEKAQKWLHEGEWVPDRNSRAYVAAMTDEDSVAPYREYYRRASKVAHPTAMSTLHYAFKPDGTSALTFGPDFDAQRCVDTLREIVIEAAFVCFAFRNALVDENAFSPDWLREVFELSREVTGMGMSHLDRDWDQMNADFGHFQTAIRYSSELDEVIDSHPNSYRNIQNRIRLLDATGDGQSSTAPEESP